MPITVKHSGNAAPQLVGAYGAGMGKRWADDGRAALARIAQEEEAQRQREFAAAEAQRSRDYQASEAEKARKFSDQQTDESRQDAWDRLNTQRDWSTQDQQRSRDWALSDQESLDKRNRSMAEFEQGLRRSDIEFTHTQQQREEFNKLSKAYDDAVKSGDYTPDELKEIKRRIVAKQAGIEPLPSLKKPSPWPAGQDIGETWKSEDGNFLMTRDKDGNVKKLGETNANPTRQDRIKAYELAQKMKLPGEGEGDADPRPIKEIVAEILGESKPQTAARESPSDPLPEDTWLPTTKQGREAYAKKKAERARAAGIPAPKSQAEYDALPSGTEYVDPGDGKRYKKP